MDWDCFLSLDGSLLVDIGRLFGAFNRFPFLAFGAVLASEVS